MSTRIAIILLLLLSACLEESQNSISMVEEFTTNSLLLREIEERGDFINTSSSSLFPSFINAETLFNNLSNYIVIDVRSSEKYNSGHILGALNVANDNLFQFVIDNSHGSGKIVIVSSSGQSASYYTYLFRIYGIPNIYSLLYGMASWNKFFENEILHFANDSGIGTDIVVHKPTQFYNLPDLGNSKDININEFFENRIKGLIKEGFAEEIFPGTDTFSSINTLNFGELKSNLSEYYTICYGTSDLYGDPKAKIAHPFGAVLYYPFFPLSDLRSTTNLQTIPIDRPVGIYSYSGHLSAMLTAHLRILGYDAKSVLFGGNDGNFTYMKNSIGAGSNYAYFGAKDYPILKE